VTPRVRSLTDLVVVHCVTIPLQCVQEGSFNAHKLRLSMVCNCVVLHDLWFVIDLCPVLVNLAKIYDYEFH